MLEEKHSRDRIAKWAAGIVPGVVIAVALSAYLRLPATDTNELDRDNSASKQKEQPSPAVATPSLQPRVSPEPTEQFPLPEERIALLGTQIDDAPDYSARLEARRALFNELRKHGQLDRAISELEALVDDIQTQEGPEMAQRVAFSEASILETNKDYTASIRALELLRCRYPNGSFEADALYQLGNCQLELHNYASAEAIWEQLIHSHETSDVAPWAWRRLALAQLLLRRFDDSLNTLATMERIYSGTEFSEYAQMRKGYVLMAMGHLDEARRSYTRFSDGHPRSKYSGIVQSQVNWIDLYEGYARAGSSKSR